MHNRLSLILCLFIPLILLLNSCTPALSEETSPFTAQPSSTMAPTTTPTDIPPQPTLEPTAEPTPTVTPLPGEYIVKTGDTLWDISQMYGVPVAFIALKNGIANINLIYQGQVLLIPDLDEVPLETMETGKQIVVILSLQTAYAYENGVLVNEFIVSTGLPDTPTVQGNFTVLRKYDSTRMTGPGYDLSNVPWVMYFYQGYSFHGTYWHDNFGNPMSHGCINMRTEEAKWLYDWAPIGTPIMIYP